MNYEFDDDPWYTLECTCGPGCPCRKTEQETHLNAVRSYMKDGKKHIYLDVETDSLGGITPPAQIPTRKTINIRGRVEHEAAIKDAHLCKTLGLDQAYETMIYLKRWGSWLADN